MQAQRSTVATHAACCAQRVTLALPLHGVRGGPQQPQVSGRHLNKSEDRTQAHVAEQSALVYRQHAHALGNTLIGDGCNVHCKVCLLVQAMHPIQCMQAQPLPGVPHFVLPQKHTTRHVAAGAADSTPSTSTCEGSASTNSLSGSTDGSSVAAAWQLLREFTQKEFRGAAQSYVATSQQRQRLNESIMVRHMFQAPYKLQYYSTSCK